MTRLGKSKQVSGFLALRDAPYGNGFQINPTLWGYVLLSEMPGEAPHAAVAMSRRMIGAVLVLAALGMWVVPNSVLGPEIAAMKLGLTILYLAVGLRFAYMPRDAVQREVQINLNRAELRVGFRNKDDMFSLQAVHSFGDVDAITLWQPTGSGEPASLFLRLGGGDTALVAARGTLAEMKKLRQRLAKDLGTLAGGFNPASVAMGRNAERLVLGPRIVTADNAA